jgi:hypothetical protein
LLEVKNNHLPAAAVLIDAGSNINAHAANKDSPGSWRARSAEQDAASHDPEGAGLLSAHRFEAMP